MAKILINHTLYIGIFTLLMLSLPGLLTGVWFTITKASMPSDLFSNSNKPVQLLSAVGTKKKKKK